MTPGVIFLLASAVVGAAFTAGWWACNARWRGHQEIHVSPATLREIQARECRN